MVLHGLGIGMHDGLESIVDGLGSIVLGGVIGMW